MSLQESPKQIGLDEKTQKRFERIFAELKEHWPWLAAGSATAASIIGLGAALLYLRKMLKNRELQKEFDTVVAKEFSEETVDTASNLQNLGIVPLAIEIGQRLEGSQIGQKIQVDTAFVLGILGIHTHNQDVADSLITAGTYVASAAEKQIKDLQTPVAIAPLRCEAKND